jgi:DNA repair ATPase RecN
MINFDNVIEQVKEFHQVYNLPIVTDMKQVTEERFNLRKGLILEEYGEFKEALADCLRHKVTVDQVMKEACDIMYVLAGALIETSTKHRLNLSNDRLNLSDAIQRVYMTKMAGLPYFHEHLSNAVHSLISTLHQLDLLHDFERAFDEVHRSKLKLTEFMSKLRCQWMKSINSTK